jgi:hypothetical protein
MAADAGAWDDNRSVSHGKQFIKVNAGADAHVFEGEHEVFRCCVAGGTWRKWTATEAAGGNVEDSCAGLVGGKRIGNAQAVGVMSYGGNWVMTR